ncbi:hypothetical protein HNY73_010905 [Argiope bruennichi]|uniref:Uncharacterized protein n=1 Tax=Argiope bruennichi TaxID=94029 RepID=A0A8T0F4J0_ARGBR|nr:hypothetical protein HNY73_010905 [Argiope bruennichi]
MSSTAKEIMIMVQTCPFLNFPRTKSSQLLRKDFKPSKSSRVYELHFKEEDIIRNMEHFHEESGCILKTPLKYPKLKPDAIPVYVQDYLQPTISEARETPEGKKKRD